MGLCFYLGLVSILKELSPSAVSTGVIQESLDLLFSLFPMVGGELEISMGDILSFFTAAEYIPPLGFDNATLNFNDKNPYPTASTCGLCLTLPTKNHDNYTGKYSQ